MKAILKYIIFVALFFGGKLWGQTENPEGISTLEMNFNPSDRQDSLGIKFLTFLKEFERYGHLNNEGQTKVNKKYIRQYQSMFSLRAHHPNDLSPDNKIKGLVPIKEYVTIAQNADYQHYALIYETRKFKLTRNTSQDKFKTKLRLMKLFDDKAISKKVYSHGVIYELELELEWNLKTIKVTNITYDPEKEYENFELGNLGYIKNTELVTSNNLEGLINEIIIIEKTREKTSMVFHAGYQLIDYLHPEPFANNVSSNTKISFEQTGWSAGINFQLPVDNKGVIRILLGGEYENNSYKLNYQNLYFIYTEDCNGGTLKDLEGAPYDTKYVDVNLFSETGYVAYLRPEAGILFQFKLGKTFKLGLNSIIGYSYPLNSSFETNTIVSYQGEKEGLGAPVSGDHLGFYTDYTKTHSATFAKAIPFFNYKLGATIDVNLNKKNALVFGFEIKKSLTPALGTTGNQCHFLDPEDNSFFESRFNNLQEEVFYEGMALTFGYKVNFGKH